MADVLAVRNEYRLQTWTEIIRECRKSGLSNREFCAQRGIGEKTYYLDEIDAQVRRYTRDTTQKIENLTNRDQNVRGNLNYLLNHLSQSRLSSELVESIQPAFQLYAQTCLSEKSLWHSRRPKKRTASDPVLVKDDVPDAKLISGAEELLRAK